VCEDKKRYPINNNVLGEQYKLLHLEAKRIIHNFIVYMLYKIIYIQIVLGECIFLVKFIIIQAFQFMFV